MNATERASHKGQSHIERRTETKGLFHRQQHQHRKLGGNNTVHEKKTTPKQKSKQHPTLVVHLMNNNTKIEVEAAITRMSYEQ